MECNDYIIPVQTEDFCNGKRYNSACVYSTNAYTLLEIEENTDLDTILNKLVIALNSALTVNNAQQTVINDLEARIIQLENA